MEEGENLMPPPSFVAVPKKETPVKTTPEKLDNNNIEKQNSENATPGDFKLSYSPPPWSAKSLSPNCRLEVLKNGVIIESHDISEKEFYLFGKIKCIFKVNKIKGEFQFAMSSSIIHPSVDR
jgi:hypothetical protein